MCIRRNSTPSETLTISLDNPAAGSNQPHALVAVTKDHPEDAFSRIAFELAPTHASSETTVEQESNLSETEQPLKPTQPTRRKLWELDSGVHCAVIGTCLTVRELHQLMRKVSIKIDPNASDYDIHRAFVGISRAPGKAAKLIHKQLDQKYRQPIRESSRLSTSKELEQLWEEAQKEGEIAGVFWALLTDMRASPALIDRIYGEVHMLSHLSGASVRIDLQELTRTKRRLNDLETAKSQAESVHRRQLKKQEVSIMALEEHIKELEAQLKARNDELERLSLYVDKARTEQLNALNEDLLNQLARSLKRLEESHDESKKWKRIAEHSTNRNIRLEAQLAEVRAEREALENTLQPLLQNRQSESECLGDECERKDLCGRCILYVGGRAKQYAHFRDLVERNNGRFLHHDGGREDNPKRLGAILSKADAVVCPLDCVSHDAVNRLKRLCESNAKRLVLIPRSSLASFARGLHEVE